MPTTPGPPAGALGALLRAGDLVVLTGDLGAGKTTLTQGIGDGLGVRGPMTSPTFVIARVHPSLVGGPDLVHVDAYRLGGLDELDDLDLDTSLEDSVTVVEWGHGLAEELTEDRIEVVLDADPGTEARTPPSPRTVPGGRGSTWPRRCGGPGGDCSLGIDTATSAIAVGLHDGTEVVAVAARVDPRGHTEHLAPARPRRLDSAGLAPRDLTDIAVGTGPGPFTGLRVGLVTAADVGPCPRHPRPRRVQPRRPRRERADGDGGRPSRRDRRPPQGGLLGAVCRRGRHCAPGHRAGGRARPADLPEELRALPTAGRAPRLYPELFPHPVGPLDVDAGVLRRGCRTPARRGGAHAGRAPLPAPPRRPDHRRAGRAMTASADRGTGRGRCPGRPARRALDRPRDSRCPRDRALLRQRLVRGHLVGRARGTALAATTSCSPTPAAASSGTPGSTTRARSPTS